MASHPNLSLRVLVVVAGCLGAVPGSLMAAFVLEDTVRRGIWKHPSDLAFGVACALLGPLFMVGSSWLVLRGHAWTHLAALAVSALLSLPVGGLAVVGGGGLILVVFLAWLVLAIGFALTLLLISAERRYPSR